MQNFRTLGQPLLGTFHFFLNLRWEVPQTLFSTPNLICFMTTNTRTTPSGRKVCDPERKKKKNNPKNSGHYVPLKGSARTSLGPNLPKRENRNPSMHGRKSFSIHVQGGGMWQFKKNHLIKCQAIFTFHFSTKRTKRNTTKGDGGSSNFLRVKPPFKFWNPRTPPFWEKSNPSRRRKMPLIEATTLCLQRLRAAHTLQYCSMTKFPPCIRLYLEWNLDLL